jgi:phospholipase C
MPAPNLDQIKTIVIVMMENRSFDHMLGYLALEENWRDMEGVRPNDPAWLAKTTNRYRGKTYQPFLQKNITGRLRADPPHEFKDIARQMGLLLDGKFPMNGFVENYANAKAKPPIISKPPVMGYFSGVQLPVTDRLARNFAVCDQWFSSLPAGTQANRLMAMAGYSLIGHNTLPLPNHELIYSWLEEREINWRVYHEGLPFFAMMPNQVGRILSSGRFKPLKDLWGDARDESPTEFPEVIFIEPSYTDAPHLDSSRDDHAPSSVVGGQQFLNEVYRSIRVCSRWQNLVMVITYDEHGGFFDHVSPPLLETKPPAGNHTNPGFRSLGVRVPALVISPFVSARHFCSNRFDHTSILKFIGEKFGTRNGHAPGYSVDVDRREVDSVYDVLNLDTARDENPISAFPDTDTYIAQATTPVGYIDGSSPPPSTLGEAFKFGLDAIRTHSDYNGKYDALLASFPADPVTHLA